MSIANKQVILAANRATEAIFKRGTIPRGTQIIAEMETMKLLRNLGLPTFEAIPQKLRSRSIVEDFNTNILDFIEDSSLLYYEQIDQGTQINRQLAASELEFRKLSNDIRTVGDLANSVVLAYDIVRRHGFYVYDTFNNTDKLDMYRTTAAVDIEAGTLELPVDRISKVDLNHLITRDTANTTLITPPGASISQISGTRFGNLFDGTLSAWIVSVTAPVLTDRAKIRFEFPLGNPISPSVDKVIGQELNRIIIKPLVPIGDDDRDRAILLSYKNSFTDGFEALPVISTTLNGADIVVDVDISSIAGWSSTPINERYLKTHITHLRVDMTKTIPDIVTESNNIYFFSLGSIDAYKIKYKSKAVAISKSNKIQGNNSIGTLNYVSLAASHFTPTSTSVNYFVAEDSYLPGVFIDDSGNVVPPGSPFVYDFEEKEDMNRPETSGVLQTELREWAIQQNGFVFQGTDYKTWEPEWRKILPVEGITGSEDGDIGDVLVKFENVSQFDSDPRSYKTNPIWANPSGLPEDTINNIDFYRIVELYDMVLPNTVVVRQGKDAWIAIEEDTGLIKTIEATGIFDGTPNLPTYISPGRIIRGTVRNVQGDLGKPQSFLTEEDDYFVEYSDTYVNITRNYGTSGDIPQLATDIVKFKVDYKITETTKTWQTHYYLDTGAEATITINMAGVYSARVINRDEETGIVIGERNAGTDGILELHTIGAGQGWFSLYIQTISDSWSPTDLTNKKVAREETVKQYAWINPLKDISFHDITHSVPKDDHTFVSVVYPDSNEHYIQEDGRSSVWLCVNDPTYPPASGGILDFNTTITHETLASGLPLSSSDIYESSRTISKFYDVSYTSISEVTDHVLVKMNLETKDTNVTPRIDGYAVRILN